MFANPKDVLKLKDGALAETPFPLLLSALEAEERTCMLELKIRQLEKRILFEEGSPVSCTSNLLHELLGKFLVEKGKLTEPQYQEALTEASATGVNMDDEYAQQIQLEQSYAASAKLIGVVGQLFDQLMLAIK